MKALMTLTWIQIKLFVREPAAFFFTLAFPALMLLLMGGIFGRGNEIIEGYLENFGIVDAMVPGFIGMAIGTVALMAIPEATSTMREQHILRRFHASPLKPMTYLGADLLSYFITTVLGVIILILIGIPVFHLRMPADVVGVGLAFMLGTLSFFAFGYLVAAIAPTSRVAQVIGNVLYFPNLFLSGATFPVETLPASMKAISDFMPLTYVVNILKGQWLGESWGDMVFSLVVVGAILVVSALIASRLFRWE